ECYGTNPLRVKNRAVLEPLLEEIFRSRTAADWIGILTREGIPCSLVRNIREVVEDEQIEARGMLTAVEHATAGQVRVTGPPVKLSKNPGSVTRAARRLGADSDAVLSELLGLGEEEIATLLREGVIAIAPAGPEPH